MTIKVKNDIFTNAVSKGGKMEKSKIAKEIIQEFMEYKKSLKKLHKNVLIDLTKGEIGILNYLEYQKNDISSIELEKCLEISSAGISKTLNNLEKKELIMRKKSEEDKRKISISITIKGKELIQKHYENINKYIENLVEKLGKEDSLELIKLIKK